METNERLDRIERWIKAEIETRKKDKQRIAELEKLVAAHKVLLQEQTGQTVGLGEDSVGELLRKIRSGKK